MGIVSLFYLSSGLFMGWALGANHMGNVFGSAVGTKMIKFRTAATLCSIFVILGCVFGGGGTSATIAKLGGISTLAGAFVAAFAAAVSIFLMTKSGLPVSTTQAIVGSIIGWCLFAETSMDWTLLGEIIVGWVSSPILAAIFSMLLMLIVKFVLKKFPVPLFNLDQYTRIGLILAGIFGSYALGANNVANVMGVFVNASPFRDVPLWGGAYIFTGTQQLFLLAGIAIACGVIFHSHKVIHTIGKGVLRMSPIAAWVVVVSHSLVLFVFSSKGLYNLLQSLGLPTIPLVPVSSAEAIVGAIIGIALLQKGKGLNWKMLAHIGAGWALTPIISIVVSFIAMFFMQNVFMQRVY